MVTPKALRRSADMTVTPSELKGEEYIYAGDTSEVSNRLATYEIGALAMDEPSYHFKLHRCASKPVVLYYQGDISLLDQPLLAMVGPRKPTSYLTQLMKDICTCLPAYIVCTISGGAQGVDELAHRGSLENGVPTIVVLGAGFRRMSRSYQRRFLQSIVEKGGLILSEWKIDQAPMLYTFPQRNRIIAGLAEVVFVPGASSGSGSLITVDFALQYHVPVATVPGSIYDPACAGTNAYLVDKKVQGVIDFTSFLSQYFVAKATHQKQTVPIELSIQEEQILTLLQENAMDITGIAVQTGTDVGEVMQHLLHLEMKHLVYCSEPGVYTRK